MRAAIYDKGVHEGALRYVQPGLHTPMTIPGNSRSLTSLINHANWRDLKSGEHV